MSATLDEISPEYLRDQRLSLRLQDATQPAAGRASVLVLDYTRAAPEGVSPPLVFEAKGPSRLGYQRTVFYTPPRTIVWVPREGGTHQVTIRELGHNKWFGSLSVSVAGESLEPE